MTLFKEYIEKIDELDKRTRLEDVLNWIHETYPDLGTVIKWNTPMFTDHDTFIISVDCAKQHISIAPEPKAMALFKNDIEAAGYSQTKGLFRIKHSETVDYDLLRKMIDYNIKDKKDCNKFWR